MIEGRDEHHLDVMLEVVEHLLRRTAVLTEAEFLADRDEIDLAAFRLSVLGEQGLKLSAQLKDRHVHLPWAKMVGLRHVVSHAYDAINPSRIWEAAQDLDPIAAMCRAELARFD